MNLNCEFIVNCPAYKNELIEPSQEPQETGCYPHREATKVLWDGLSSKGPCIESVVPNVIALHLEMYFNLFFMKP